MSGKIGADAFSYYVALGDGRSYEKVARHYGVTKRGIVKAASREDWKFRLGKIEREVVEKTDQYLVAMLAKARTRHMVLLRAAGDRIARALTELPIDTPARALRAAEAVLLLERALVGGPDE